MFGGFGDTFKNLTSQVEDAVEKTKKEVEELAIEKKNEAQSMLEQQAKKTGEALWNAKAGVEKTAVGAAVDAKKSAIDGFDKECATAEKTAEGAVKETTAATTEAAATTDAAADAATAAKGAVAGALGGMEGTIHTAVGGAVKQVEQVVDSKLKEADQFLDEKRDDLVKQVKDATSKAGGQAEEGIGSVLGKAKGLLNF
uniref:Uncharacterized protein n=1 Tax=Graphocephala atropunctata TaxID=36148 RepID=A0A1B6LC39_9HEMI